MRYRKVLSNTICYVAGWWLVYEMKEFFFLSPPPFLASLWPLLSFHYFTCHFDILAFGASFDGNRFGFEFEFLLRCLKYCAISFYKIEKNY